MIKSDILNKIMEKAKEKEVEEVKKDENSSGMMLIGEIDSAVMGPELLNNIEKYGEASATLKTFSDENNEQKVASEASDSQLNEENSKSNTFESLVEVKKKRYVRKKRENIISPAAEEVQEYISTGKENVQNNIQEQEEIIMHKNDIEEEQIKNIEEEKVRTPEELFLASGTSNEFHDAWMDTYNAGKKSSKINVYANKIRDGKFYIQDGHIMYLPDFDMQGKTEREIFTSKWI